MWRYAIPFASWGLVSWLQTASDRWCLELFRDAKAVGAFTVAYQIGYLPLFFLSLALSSYIGPTLFHRGGDGSDPERLRHANAINWLHVVLVATATITISGLEYLYSDRLIALLSTREYAALAHTLPAMTLAAGFFSIGQALTFFFLVESDSASLAPVKIFTALIGGSLNCYLVFRSGVEGAVVGAVAFGAIYMLWMLLVTVRKVGRSGPVAQPLVPHAV
jgi:O-antigen/teichoic acid export membrane protein